MKKLSGWARSRSRRRGSQGKDVEKRGSAENLTSPNGKAVSSKTAPPVPEIPREFRSRSSLETNNTRPGSDNKTKPMFIGVSRPSTTLSRPGTSGSFLNAVTLAADKVAQSNPLNLQRGLPKSGASPELPSTQFQPRHTRKTSARHVDIFSISNPDSSFTSYNEDIAKRNLDTNIVAKEIKRNGYVPSSKYQEEVAARNAVAPLRPTTDQVRLSSSDGYRPNYAELRAYGATQAHEVDVPRSPDGDTQKSREAQRIAQHDYRRQGQLSGGPVQMAELPAVSQVRVNPKTNEHNRSISRSVVTQQNQPKFQRDSPVVPYSRQSAEVTRQPSHDSRPSSASRTVPSSMVRAGTLPGYQVSQSEMSQPREADTLSISQQSTSERPGLPERAASSLSTTSSIKRAITLPRRTIMDLTGNDSEVFSDGYPDSYMSRSPVPEEARQNSIFRIQPFVVNAAASTAPPHGSMLAVHDGDVTPRPSTAIAENGEHLEFPVHYQPPNAFSAINTIASMSSQGNDEANRRAVPNSKPVPPGKETRKPASSKLYTVAETEPEQEEHDIIARAIKALSMSSRLLSDPDASQSEVFSAPITDLHDFATGEKGVVQKATVPPSPTTSMRSSARSEFAQPTPNGIQMSPESLNSADFINPSESFGIRTRDFAVTPSRQTASHSVSPNRTERESNTGAKVMSPPRSKSVAVAQRELLQLAQPTDSAVAPYSSDFNEGEFKFKQELARAALIKLQQSLDEDFVSPPREPRKVQSRVNSLRRHADSTSSSDGRPHAPPPAINFPQVRDYNRPTTSQVNGYSDSREQSRPRPVSSVHEQVTNARSPSQASTTTVKPTRRERTPNPDSRDMAKQNSKGKDRELSNHMLEMQRLADEMRTTKLTMPNPSQQRIYEDAVSALPRSPGEISLSSFPVPTPAHSRQVSTVSNNITGASHQHTSSVFSSYSRVAAAPSPVVSPIPPSPDLQQRPYLSRRGSMKSQTSVMTSTSQHSIPFHLIPERGSSMRDSMVMEDDLET